MTFDSEIKQRLNALYSDRSLKVDEVRCKLTMLRNYINTLLEALVETDEERDI